jgi:hypothetical protein
VSDSDAADTDELPDATTRLRERLGRTEGNGTDSEAADDGDSEGSAGSENGGETGSEDDGDLADAAKLVTRAETDLEDLLGIVRGDREGTLEEAQDDLEDLLEVIDEAEDLLSTVDLSALAKAVEWTDLPKAIEGGDVPEAIAEGEASEAVNFRKLLQVVNLRKVLGNVDLRDLRREKEDVEEAAEDLTDDEDDEDDEGGLLDRFTDKDSEESDDEGGILDRFRSDETGSSDEGADDGIGPGVMGEDRDDEEGAGGGIPSELIQAKVQSELGDAIDQFRDSALDARDQLNEMRERSKKEFREKTGRTGQPSSRNPTAYSSLPAPPDDRPDIGGVARFSTMSRTPRHSSAPSRDHIYGDRFENRNQEEDEDDE